MSRFNATLNLSRPTFLTQRLRPQLSTNLTNNTKTGYTSSSQHYYSLLCSDCLHKNKLSHIKTPIRNEKTSMLLFNQRRIFLTHQNSLKEKSSHIHDGKSLLDRFVYVKTLNDFYEDVPNGIVYDTAYADSRPNEEWDSSMPVIVGLHDSPGDHSDLVSFLDFFAKVGCRAVCPTFPGHGHSKSVIRGHGEVFSQTSLERAHFVTDFLGNLDIRRVDVVVGVGASCYTAMALCTHNPDLFKSTALLSPWSFSKLRHNVDPKHLKILKEMWDMPFMRPWLRLFLRSYRMGEAKSSQDKITLAYLLSNIDFGEVCSHAMSLSLRKVPYIVSFKGQHEDSIYDKILTNLEINQQAVFKLNDGLKNVCIPGALELPSSDQEILSEHRGVLSAYILKLVQRRHPHIKV